MPIKQLREAISKHDFSYEYSDDHRWWKAGTESLGIIKELSKGIDPKVIKSIWNSEVSKKFKGDEFKINLETAKEWSQNGRNKNDKNKMQILRT